ncbi:MAG: hypothetical protein Q7S27_02455 [Nanoarchaeota archaeon]|nr:hypothetical protein [Nanoarchaeota archaeon]
MGLIEKIKNGGRKLFLAGALGSGMYASGCLATGTPQQHSNFLFRDILGFPGIDENSNQGGNTQNNQNNHNNQKSAQRNRGNKSQEAVSTRKEDLTIQYPPIKTSPDFGQFVVIAYNYDRDFNNNGAYDYPTDFSGIKKVFSKGERIELGLLFFGNNLSTVKYELLNKNGTVLESFSHSKSRINGIYNLPEEELKKIRESGIQINGEVETLSPGDYRAVWTSNGKLIDMLDIKVVE